MPDDAHLQPAVAAELDALAAALEPLTPEQWDTASLCAGWRIREVVAHLTMAARYPEDAFMAKLREHDFDFTATSDAIAAQDADLPTADLIANLRSDAQHHWAPPGGGYVGALNHAVVHGLDATVPLGLGHVGPAENLRTILDSLTNGGGHENFGVPLDGRRLRATDADWSFGDGEQLAASSADLVLMIAARDVPPHRREGQSLRRSRT